MMTTAALVVLAALGSLAPAGTGSTERLVATSWKAIELDGRPVPPARAGRAPSLVFDARGRLSGADGCGRVAGSYQMMGPIIKFGRIAEPPGACPGGRDAGRAFRAALASAHVWRIKDDRLELRDSSGTLVARFESPAARSAPHSATSAALEHTTWRLVRFKGDETVLVPDDSSKYILAFGEYGSLSALVDCQRGRGTWKASGRSALQFGPLTMTPSRCPSSTPLRGRLASDWRRVQSYIIRNGHLFLALMGDGGAYEFEPLRSAK
jgi:heat shock protein HslJ